MQKYLLEVKLSPVVPVDHLSVTGDNDDDNDDDEEEEFWEKV